jgi:putative transposase
MEPRRPYATDLSDREWALIQHLVPAAKLGGRPEQYPTREILDAIFSSLRRGCAWRLLPHDFPPWQLVYQYCWRWRKDGTWQHIHDMLRGAVRVAAGKRRQPSAGSIDRQSIKTTETGGAAAMTRTSTSRGASGISWSIPSGLLLAVVVTAANVQDRDGAKSVLAVLRHKFSRLRPSWADGAYAGPLVDWVRDLRRSRPIRLEITKRSNAVKGFVVIPKRWVVERTFGWRNRYRRLSKDDELLPDTSQAVIQVSMIHVMVRRLTRIAPY